MAKNTVTLDPNYFMLDCITKEVSIRIEDDGYWITFGSDETGCSSINMAVSKMDLTMLKNYLQSKGL
jgi:hypothetical protein